MPRQRAYDREQVLERASEVFWRKGYQATSIQDLVDATGINRASMYTAFGSKTGFFNAVLDRYMNSGALVEIVNAGEDMPFPKLMAKVFAQIIDQATETGDRRGCLLTNTAVELSPHDPTVAEKIKRELLALEAALTRRIENAQRRDEVTPDFDPASLARSLVNTIQGMRVFAKVNPDREALSDIAGMALRQLIP